MSYNHQEALKNLTPQQRQENLEWVKKSYGQAMTGKPVTCRGCKKDFKLVMLYRCYFCGSYFCAICGKAHWGSRGN